jgi:transcriptional regulator SbtR-like protein
LLTRTTPSSGRIAAPATRERITAALATLLAAGAEAGSLRADVGPEDATVLLLGVFLADGTAEGGRPGRTGRLTGLFVDVLRPRPRG